MLQSCRPVFAYCPGEFSVELLHMGSRDFAPEPADSKLVAT